MGRSSEHLARLIETGGSPLERELVGAVHRLYNARHGAGPSEVGFELDARGRLVCTMRELLTPEERERVEGHDRLRDERLFVRHADRELIEAIEQITGQRVSAVQGRVDPAADTVTELFEFGSPEHGLRSVDRR